MGEKGFLVKGLFGEEKLNFQVRHSVLRLGKGVDLHIEGVFFVYANLNSPTRRGSPRRR